MNRWSKLWIPTISAAAEEELDVLDVIRRSSVLQLVEQWRGLRAIDVESTSGCQRNAATPLPE
jgi:hypothetical protein